jgi:hypothetical protein
MKRKVTCMKGVCRLQPMASGRQFGGGGISANPDFYLVPLRQQASVKRTVKRRKRQVGKGSKSKSKSKKQTGKGKKRKGKGKKKTSKKKKAKRVKSRKLGRKQPESVKRRQQNPKHGRL